MTPMEHQQPICQTCRVVHQSVPPRHQLSPEKRERAWSYSLNWWARKQFDKEMLARRRNHRMP